MAVLRVLVQERVRRRIRGLTDRAGPGGQRRKQHEEIERHALRRDVEIARAGHFRRQSFTQFRSRQPGDQSAARDTRAVQHAVECAELLGDLLDQFLQLGAVCDIHAPVMDAHPGRGELAQPFAPGGAQDASAGDDDGGRILRAGDVGDHCTAEAAKAAGHQIHAAVAPGECLVLRGQFDFAQRVGADDLRPIRIQRDRPGAKSGRFRFRTAQQRGQRDI